MQRIFAMLPAVARASSTVVIEGESGTGKELVARALHALSPRRDEPLVTVNCGALPDTLLESELFGYKAGAFTDARKDKPGRFALAEGGTIFLDEIGDVSPALQVRLLRVLEQKIYEPLGGTESLRADVRIVDGLQQAPGRFGEGAGRFGRICTTESTSSASPFPPSATGGRISRSSSSISSPASTGFAGRTSRV